MNEKLRKDIRKCMFPYLIGTYDEKPLSKEQAIDFLGSDKMIGISVYFGHTQCTATLPDGSYWHGKDIFELADKLRRVSSANRD
jgi:hypothetical protein